MRDRETHKYSTTFIHFRVGCEGLSVSAAGKHGVLLRHSFRLFVACHRWVRSPNIILFCVSPFRCVSGVA